MMLELVFLIVFNVIVRAEDSSPFTDNNKNDYALNNVVSQALGSPRLKNLPYIERDENLVRLPIMSRSEGHHMKKKQKKVPKRTIQKIIKKNKMKSKIRKVYYSQRTNKPTTKIDYDKFYGSEDQNYERTTTQTQNQRKRARKFNNKVARYHLPFQNSQMKNNYRHKRDWSRELYILKKLDEAEFLKGGDNYDVIKTQAKNPW